jgi:predicted CDP-diglyceride synthetase/phosphatidate cytidylyltransferase
VGTFLIVLGSIIGALGILAVLATLTNVVANTNALVLLLIGAVFFVGGAIVDAVKAVRQELRESGKK